MTGFISTAWSPAAARFYVTRLLRTLKSLGITLSVTFDLDVPADGESGSDG